MSQWRVAIGQKQYGPYSLEKLREIYAEGRVPEDARIWHPQRQTWMEAGDVPELHSDSAGEDEFIIKTDAPSRRKNVERRPASRSSRGGGTVMDYLAFRRMITPIIIQVVFWIGAVGAGLSGIGLIIVGLRMQELSGVLAGLFTMFLGPLVVWIYCELVIVFFRMHETLRDIREELKRSA